MKKIIILLITSFAWTSCFKDYNKDFLLTEKTVEFEDAVTISNASGHNFPILPTIFSISGVASYQVNMFGEQSLNDQQVVFRVVEEHSTAVEGRDYQFVAGNSLIVPKHSSFGYLEVQVLPTIEGSKLLVVELVGNDEVKVSQNYKTIGISMSNAVTEPDPTVIEDFGDYLHITDITLGGDENPDLGSFIDLQTGDIYNWEGAALYSEKATVAYFHSGSNHVNFVFPGMASMGTAWPSYYNRILNWSVAPTGKVTRFTNVTQQELDLYFNNLNSASDIEDIVLQAESEVATRHGSASTYGPGERVRQLSPGDLVFLYSSTHDFYAVIRILEADHDGTGPREERAMRVQYKVQK